jgi:group I intron endonuclease
MIIYKAENIINNKVYIGKTIQTLNSRINQHKYEAFESNRYNFYFYRAIRKYGWDNFQWEILCETDSESKLNVLEKFYIAVYGKMNKLYNCTNGGDGGFSFTEETLKKMSKAQTGRKHSPETIEKLRQINYGNKYGLGRKHSLQTKKKLSLIKQNQSESTKEKNRQAHIGKKKSEETKKKISETRIKNGIAKKEKNPMWGKKRPDLTKRNLKNNPGKYYKSKNLMEK